MTGHVISIDETTDDHIDTYAAKAFCDTEGCGWAGEWHHADHADDAPLGDREAAEATAYGQAQDDAAEHEAAGQIRVAG